MVSYSQTVVYFGLSDSDSTRSLTVLQNGGCTELELKDSWWSVVHLTNITNKLAGKNLTLS